MCDTMIQDEVRWSIWNSGEQRRSSLFFLFSRCDILVVATRWRECWGDLLPASLDLLRHLRVTYGADFAEQMAGAVEVGRTIAPRRSNNGQGKAHPPTGRCWAKRPALLYPVLHV